MVHARGSNKYERVTITLVPSSDERSFRHIPSTFSVTDRTYSWRHFEQMEYMLVPRRIASNEIKVDVFVDAGKKGRLHATQIQKAVQHLVTSKINREWAGLRLGSIGRATAAAPPEKAITRGTIEEILGTKLD